MLPTDGDVFGEWRVEKIPRLTMGSQREMMNGVLLVFFLIRSSQYSVPQAV